MRSDLSPKTTDATLNDAFADFGVVLDAVSLRASNYVAVAFHALNLLIMCLPFRVQIVMRSPNTGLSLRFGFVLYETGDEAQAAIYGMNEQE